MQAIISAAAGSPRLLPLTKNTPISLLEVGEKPIISHQLSALNKAGIHDTVVITGFCATQLENYCQGKASYIFNPFYEMCHVAMNLWVAKQKLGSGFIFIYGDIIFEAELIEEMVADKSSILIAVDPTGLDKEAEKVSVKNGLLETISKDVTNPYGEFIGIAKFSKDMITPLVEELDTIARTDLSATFPSLLKRIIDSGHSIKIHTSNRPWIDIDFPNDLENARKIYT